MEFVIQFVVILAVFHIQLPVVNTGVQTCSVHMISVLMCLTGRVDHGRLLARTKRATAQNPKVLREKKLILMYTSDINLIQNLEITSFFPK